MIQYKVGCEHPHRHFISFEATFATSGKDKLQLQLPSWRPGRYELGNFAKNIRAWSVTGLNGEACAYEKRSKDLWEVNCKGHNEIVLHYQYYASELNAGSSYLDDEQLYINPVNCFFYVPDQMEEAIEVSFFLPEDYEIACGLEKKSKHVLLAKNFDELADCPLIAGNKLKHLNYSVEGVLFHIWIQGNVKLDEARLVNEFAAFTKEQFRIFASIPCKEYHFLFHFTPYFLRHGVEHSNSTVIAMGPAADFQNDVLFKDLLGISCHELFHTWNVKSIRPADMLPYDFTRENYSRLGYVYEGVTTYYGDMLLWRCGAISDAEWFEMIEERIQDYIDNAGRKNLSVAESSFDTWLDGYGAGIPWRKVSIYNEGFLLALILDLKIIVETNAKKSFDQVMKMMFEEFGQLKKGYTEEDYLRIISQVAGLDMKSFFTDYINGNREYINALQEVLTGVGLSANFFPSAKWSESMLGMTVEESVQKTTVLSVMEGSPSDLAGCWNGDEIVALNGQGTYKNFQLLLKMQGGAIGMTVLRKGQQKELHVLPDGECWGKKCRLMRNENYSEREMQTFVKWKSGN